MCTISPSKTRIDAVCLLPLIVVVLVVVVVVTFMCCVCFLVVLLGSVACVSACCCYQLYLFLFSYFLFFSSSSSSFRLLLGNLNSSNAFTGVGAIWNTPLCVGHKPLAEHNLDYLMQFWNKYKDVGKFASLFLHEGHEVSWLKSCVLIAHVFFLFSYFDQFFSQKKKITHCRPPTAY